MNEEKKIKDQLSVMEDQHRELDMRASNNTLCEMERQRIKKQKLFLKDQMVSLKSALYSDIIA